MARLAQRLSTQLTCWVEGNLAQRTSFLAAAAIEAQALADVSFGAPMLHTLGRAFTPLASPRWRCETQAKSRPSQTKSDQVRPSQTEPGPVRLNQTKSDRTRPSQTQSDPVRPNQAQSDSVRPSQTQSSQILANPPPASHASQLTSVPSVPSVLIRRPQSR